MRSVNAPWLFGCFLTDIYGGFPSQQQLQTLAVISQAAVVQRRAAFSGLLIQIQTKHRHKKRKL